MNSFSRVTTVLVLVFSLLATSLSVLAQTTTTLPPPPPPAPTNSAKTTPDTKKAEQTQPTKSTKSTKPLSTNENPEMIGKRNINTGFWSKISRGMESEVRAGRQAAAEIDRQVKFVDDPVITEYVNRVGQNIVLHSDAKVPFTIKVIDSDEVNAFALPGGFFYVNKGLVLAADNEAELAGVMAHEIAHVAARHAAENERKGQVMQYGILIPAIIFGGGIGQAIYQGGGFGALLGFMKFSRGAEEEADKLSVQYMYAAGYDPTAMATMFEKLEAKNKKKPGFISKLFASHPAPPERRVASLELAGRFPDREEYVISTSEFQRVKGRLLRLSNARASTSAVLPGAEEGAPGRPTLKRRQPTPDDPTATTPDGEQKPVEKSEPPKLKRNDGSTTKPNDP